MSDQWNPGSVPPPGPPAGPPQGAPMPPPVPGGDPYAGPPPQVPVGPPPKGRSKGKVVVGAVAVVALLAAGGFAVAKFAGGGDSEANGAATPDELGEQLLVAFDDSDALAAAELLLPSEREVISDPAFDLVDELERLEVLSDVDLENINGLEVELADTQVDVESTNADDIVVVNMYADATLTVDAEELPTGPIIDEELEEADTAAEDSRSREDFEIQLVGVEEDGEWYLSVGFTIAELMRQSDFDEETGDVKPIPAADDAVQPAGAGSPEGAFENMVQAVMDEDVEAMIAGLDPGEFGALQRYAPLFLEDAQESLDEADLELELTELDVRVEGDGDRREVFIESLAIQFAADGEEGYVQYSDGCVTVEADGESDEVCFTGDEVEAQLDNLTNQFEDPEPVEEFIDAFKDAFADFEVPGIVVTEVDGEWYVSPVATFDGAVLSVAEALDADELRDLIDKAKAAFEEFEDSGGFPGELPD